MLTIENCENMILGVLERWLEVYAPFESDWELIDAGWEIIEMYLPLSPSNILSIAASCPALAMQNPEEWPYLDKEWPYYHIVTNIHKRLFDRMIEYYKIYKTRK